jgi:preprotein translocase subunit SecD
MRRLTTISLTGLLVLMLSGCASRPHAVTVRFHEQVSERLPESRVRLVAVPKTGLTVPVNPFPSLSERDLVEAKLQPTAGGDAVLLQFDSIGAHVLEGLTTASRDQYLVVFVNDKPVAAVLMDHSITNGQFLLEGDFTDAEAREWVAGLNKVTGRRRDFGDTHFTP